MQFKLNCFVLVVNYCQSNPCLNNGSCSNSVYYAQYSCYCKPGYLGMNCEGTVLSFTWTLHYFELLLICCIKSSFLWIRRRSTLCSTLRFYIVLLVLDACSSYPCHYGYCNNINNGSSYNCSCYAGASGKNCENGE